MERYSFQEIDRYRSPLPYPSVEGCRPNPFCAQLISGAYAGRISELTALTQYTVHNFYTASHPRVHTAFKYIALVELTHFQLLGQLLIKLGGEPILASFVTHRYWGGSFPEYAQNVDQILRLNIQAERSALDNYKKIIAQIRDDAAVKVLRRIVLDEEKHIQVLEALLRDMNRR